MSSKFVRDSVINFIAAELPSEKFIDLTAEFEELEDLLTYHDIASGDDWVGIQFIGSDEVPVDVRAGNAKGTYRENGVFYMHIVSVAKLGGHNAILDRAESARTIFRGQRIGTIIIEAVSPPNFGNGISLNFSGGYTACTFTVDYQNDINL
jgi:hypothetical protein